MYMIYLIYMYIDCIQNFRLKVITSSDNSMLTSVTESSGSRKGIRQLFYEKKLIFATWEYIKLKKNFG